VLLERAAHRNERRAIAQAQRRKAIAERIDLHEARVGVGVVGLDQRPVVVDGNALMMGYAGVYPSFLLHTERAAAKLGVDPRDVLVEIGKRNLVGGQEDLIVDVALELSKRPRFTL
jgi:hypothetical protein